MAQENFPKGIPFPLPVFVPSSELMGNILTFQKSYDMVSLQNGWIFRLFAFSLKK